MRTVHGFVHTFLQALFSAVLHWCIPFYGHFSYMAASQSMGNCTMLRVLV